MKELKLRPHQTKLIQKFAGDILGGSRRQEYETFQIIFERVPEDDEILIFRDLCKIAFRGKDLNNIRGVIYGEEGIIRFIESEN